MCIYEKHGINEQQEYGRQIACCNIQRFWIIRRYDDMEEWQKTQADEEGVKVIDEKKYFKLFGEKFDPKKIMPDWSPDKDDSEDKEERNDDDEKSRGGN